jgi:hypothetical protein
MPIVWPDRYALTVWRRVSNESRSTTGVHCLGVAHSCRGLADVVSTAAYG